VNNRYLLDSWALLAWLYEEEPAASRIEQLLHDAIEHRNQLMLPVINLGEVYYIFGRARGEAAADELITYLKKLPLQILPVNERKVMTAAQYKMRHAISYADAFAAAEAKAQNAVLLTGDPELFALDGEIEIEQLYRSPL
jgi:predicted nucleic acid-binding protein